MTDLIILVMIAVAGIGGGMFLLSQAKDYRFRKRGSHPVAYPPDDGPLSVADIEHIRATAEPLLPKGTPLRKRSLLDL